MYVKKWSILESKISSHVLHSPGEFQETRLSYFSNMHVYMDHLSSCEKKNVETDGARLWCAGSLGTTLWAWRTANIRSDSASERAELCVLVGQDPGSWVTALFPLYWELYFTFLWFFQSTLTVLELRHTTKGDKYFLLTSKCETRPPYLLWKIHAKKWVVVKIWVLIAHSPQALCKQDLSFRRVQQR